MQCSNGFMKAALRLSHTKETWKKRNNSAKTIFKKTEYTILDVHLRNVKFIFDMCRLNGLIRIICRDKHTKLPLKRIRHDVLIVNI